MITFLFIRRAKYAPTVFTVPSLFSILMTIFAYVGKVTLGAIHKILLAFFTCLILANPLFTQQRQKSNKVHVWTAINHYAPGILAMQIGDRSGETFIKLWNRIKNWTTRRFLTDGYCIYAIYIEPERHRVLPKTCLTRIEGENTRLRHYLARLHRKTLCYSKSEEILKYSVRLLMYYLRFKTVPVVSLPT